MYESLLIDTKKFENLEKVLCNDQKRTGNNHLNETKIRQSNTLDQTDFQEVIGDRINAYRLLRAITKAYKYSHGRVYKWISRHANADVRATALHDAPIKHLKIAAIILNYPFLKFSTLAGSRWKKPILSKVR